MSATLTIPQASPLQGYKAYQAEIDAAIDRVLSLGYYILGEEVKTFEAEFASYIGVKYGIGVGSGTDALQLALWACGVKEGTEVITVSHTAVATVTAIRLMGATPVFVDIDNQTMTMDPTKIESLVTSRTKAIVPVHLYGHPVDLNPLLAIAKHHGLYVVEDCAQSHGAKYYGQKTGSFGHLGCFSFYPTKNLGAIGDGGMIVTNHQELAERIQLLRQYGWQNRYVSMVEGTNSRLDELQAAILRIKLRHLDEDNRRRYILAAKYQEMMAHTSLLLPYTASWAEHCFHQYVLRLPQRDDLASYLRTQGIGTQIHYPVPVHMQPAYQNLNDSSNILVHTEAIAKQVLSMPMYPELPISHVELIAQAINSWFRN